MDQLLADLLIEESGKCFTVILCANGAERAQVLEELRDLGCNINHGDINRELYIANPDYRLHYHSPRLDKHGDVSCVGGVPDEKHVVPFSDFMKYIHKDDNNEPILPPDLCGMFDLLS